MKLQNIGVVKEEGHYNKKDNLATRLIQDFDHYYVIDKLAENIYYFDSETVPYLEFIQEGKLDILFFMSEKMIDEAREIKAKFPQLKVVVLCEELPINEVVCIKADELTCKGYLELLTELIKEK